MNNAARKAACWLLLSVPFTLALVFSSAFDPPFAAPKNAILALTACAAAALAFTSRWKPERESRSFWIAAAIYGAITLVSALHVPGQCLEGVLWPVWGLLLMAAAIAALSGDAKAANTRTLQIAIASAAVLVSLVAGLQFFAIDLQGAFGLYANSAGRMRMYSTLGNPDFVAAFLAVALPAAVGLSLTARRLRVLWIAAWLLIGAAIVLTGSRAGVIAAAVGVAVVAATVMKKKRLGLAAAVAAIALACALAAGTQLNPRTAGESLRGRAFIWQVALGDGAARSVFGGGPGTFAYEYPVRLGRFFAASGREPLLRFAAHERHAQNDFVEAWHDTGWFGLLSLVALLSAWFAVALSRLRAEKEARSAIAVAIASVTAFCIASLFDFPMHRAETWALLWLSVAVPLLSTQTAAVRKPRWPGLAVAVLLLIAGSYAGMAPLAASYELAKGETAEDQGNLQSSLAAYRSALRWQPSSPDANFNLARALAKTGDYDRALVQSSVATRYVNEPELYLLRSRILDNAGRKDEARRELEAALKVFPYSKELRDELVPIPFSGQADVVR